MVGLGRTGGCWTCWTWRLRRCWPTKFPVDPVDLVLQVVASGPKLTNRTLTIVRVRRWTQWRAAIHAKGSLICL